MLIIKILNYKEEGIYIDIPISNLYHNLKLYFKKKHSNKLKVTDCTDIYYYNLEEYIIPNVQSIHFPLLTSNTNTLWRDKMKEGIFSQEQILMLMEEYKN